MIHLIFFLLIYSSEETTYYLFSLIYLEIVPTYLHPNEYKKNSNLIDKDIDHILEILKYNIINNEEPFTK